MRQVVSSTCPVRSACCFCRSSVTFVVSRPVRACNGAGCCSLPVSLGNLALAAAEDIGPTFRARTDNVAAPVGIVRICEMPVACESTIVVGAAAAAAWPAWTESNVVKTHRINAPFGLSLANCDALGDLSTISWGNNALVILEVCGWRHAAAAQLSLTRTKKRVLFFS